MPLLSEHQAQYLDALRKAPCSPEALLAGLAAALADRLGCPPRAVAEVFPADPAWVPPVPEQLAAPDLLGAAHEGLLSADERRSRGVHYTPPEVADGLVAVALPPTDHPPTVCDPSLGGGAFLLAAGRALARRGLPRDLVVRELLYGADLDPLAVAVAGTSLALWSGEADGVAWPGEHLCQGDALALEPERRWGRGRFDFVVGNPPFSSPLDARGRTPVETEEARRRLVTEIGPYTDEAALFLLVGLRLARRGGRVALLQPESFLAARDAAPVRARVLEEGVLAGLWLADDGLFDAEVRVCSPVIDVGVAPVRDVGRWIGARFQPATPAPPVQPGEAWSGLVADLRGVPPVDLVTRGTLGDLCTVGAGFRDEYYGLRDAVREAPPDAEPPGPSLVTAGVIDPAVCHWGHRPLRFARRSWEAPWVDLDRLAPRIRRWVEGRLTPKLVLAPQTAVIEAAVDEDGGWVPCTPLITLRAAPERLWPLAAALLAPPVSALAHRWGAGTGLGRDVVRLTVSQVASLPQPADHGAWQQGADAVAAAAHAPGEAGWRHHLLEAGRAMTLAYGLDPDHEVRDWWAERLPGWRRTPTSGGAPSVPSRG